MKLLNNICCVFLFSTACALPTAENDDLTPRTIKENPAYQAHTSTGSPAGTTPKCDTDKVHSQVQLSAVAQDPLARLPAAVEHPNGKLDPGVVDALEGQELVAPPQDLLARQADYLEQQNAALGRKAPLEEAGLARLKAQLIDGVK